jgi:hypothetical protein
MTRSDFTAWLYRYLLARPGLRRLLDRWSAMPGFFRRRIALVTALLPVLGLGILMLMQAVTAPIHTASGAQDAPVSELEAAKLSALLAPHSLQQGEMPVYGWTVCADMGIGPVPGVPDPRQRFRLCHPDGWRVRVYCIQPDWLPPALGASCSRYNDTDFFCGQNLQNLRIYQVLDTPTPTPTFTSTPTNTPTATSTPAPTATGLPTLTPTNTPVIPSPLPTRFVRPQAGGLGFRDLLGLNKLSRVWQATPTPFWPNTPTPFMPELPTPTAGLAQAPEATLASPPFIYEGVDLSPGSARVSIRIQPDNQRVNAGQPIDLDFLPARRCPFGDQRACTAAYYQNDLTPVTYVSVHSGLGGEAEALRRALEGTGFDSAGATLPQVYQRMKAITGSMVQIQQEDLQSTGYQVASVVRIPASRLKHYLSLPLEQALALAAELEPDLTPLLESGEPLLVLETCGWRMPGEPWPGGLSDTSSSIYLFVIHPLR